MLRVSRRSSLSFAAAILSIPTSLLAQSGPVGPGSSTLKDTTLEEVIVTATKTGASRLQDTPLPISAFTADQLKRTLSSNIKDLAQYTPSLNISIANASTIIVLRGIGTNNVANGSDPDVTMQIDGVYIARPSAMGQEFLDVDRVEVLRGPQGTLYGRNAIGGTINIISPRPSDTFQGQVALTGGNFNLGEIQGYVNGPIIPEKLQGSLSGTYVRHDDYFTNIVPNGPSGVNNANHGGIRGQLRFEPTSWLDATTRGDFVSLNEHLEILDHLVVPFPPAPLADSTIGNPSKIAINSPSNLVLHGGGVSEEIDVRLPSDFALKSLTAYRENDYYQNSDNDATEANAVVGHFGEKENQLSEEINITKKFKSLDLVAGAFYFDENASTNVYALVNGPGIKINSLPFFNTKSYAGFGQGVLHITSSINLTAGVRYTSEDKSINSTVLRTVQTTGALLPGFPLVFNLTKHFDAFTPKFGLDWKITPNTLVYATITRGYKSGGTNYAASSVAAASFNPESLWSYEAGFKTDLLDKRLRLNVTGFHYDYSNLQIQSVLVPGLVTILNAANATVNGIEAELTARLTPTLRVDANLSGLDATYGTFPKASVPAALAPFVVGDPRYNPATGNYNAAGKRLNQAPRYSGTVAVQNDFPLESGAVVTARGDVYFQDRVFYEPTNSLQQSQGAYRLLNVQLGYTSADKLWQVTLWGKNLTDKHYFIAFQSNGVEPDATAAPPRTFGVRLSRSW